MSRTISQRRRCEPLASEHDLRCIGASANAERAGLIRPFLDEGEPLLPLLHALRGATSMVSPTYIEHLLARLAGTTREVIAGQPQRQESFDGALSEREPWMESKKRISLRCHAAHVLWGKFAGHGVCSPVVWWNSAIQSISATKRGARL